MMSEWVVPVLWLLPLPPLLAFGAIVLFANRSNRLSHSLAIGAAGLSWLGSMLVFWRAVTTEHLAEHPFGGWVLWLPTGETWLTVGVQMDALGAVTLFFVAWTVLMIFIYSVGYHNFGAKRGVDDRAGLPPHGALVKGVDGHKHHVPSLEPMYARFFALISLFAFAMYLLVVSDNLLTLFVGWEVMGLCSYLLIGFWYGKPSARAAAVKAFLTTRVGDMFLLLGMAILYSLTGTLRFADILGNASVLAALAGQVSPVLGLSWAGLIGLLLFLGVVGKSAQFPLHVWLPDAMEGPTPVSAMIHAATMVSAGVYLAARFFPLLSAGWQPGMALTPTMMVMAVIGAGTALFAATIALAQDDIKRVLAYSTISQLGYMIAALGIGAYAAAVFHLVTHAFFKALLFLGSGSVIHGMEHGALHTGEHEDVQNMHKMGGLRKKMPVTFVTFLLGGLSLAGAPLLTAGFWSKDEILSGALNGGFVVVFVVLALAALLTAFYTARQITLTFLGTPRSKAAEHAHESRWEMTLPLGVLAVFAVSAGWAGIPETFPGLGGLIPNWFGEFVGGHALEHEVSHSPVPLLTSLLVSLGGLLLGWLVYRRQVAGAADPLAKTLGPVYSLLKNKYYIDEFYAWLLIRPARWLSETLVADWMDRRVLDGILHGLGRFGIWLGEVLRRWFDLPVVNGAGDGVGRGSRWLGTVLSPLQNGHEQTYMLTAVIGLVTAGVAFILLVVF